MHLTAKADYAVRAVVELASASQVSPRKLDDIASAQAIPISYLTTILLQLRDAGLLRSQRGSNGGYWLASAANELDLASVIEAVAGPLVAVRGQVPEELAYLGSAMALQQVWVALHASLRKVLEGVTIADIATGHLPQEMLALACDTDTHGLREVR